MAISWGPWEYSGGNGMRVGLDVSWTEGSGDPIVHGSVNAKATVKVYTENQFSYSDSQTLNYSGAIGGSHSFTNNAGGAQILRDTVVYTYSYGSCEYGSSPGSRTFTATISGAFNGVTPSKSVTSSIPKRPYDSPAAPTNVNSTRISDSALKTTWTNKDTCGEPWDNLRVQRDVLDNGIWNAVVGTPGGGATSFTDNDIETNQVYRYRVRAENSVGNSSYVVSNDLLYTTPATPTDLTRTGANGANQVLSWTNPVNSYMDHRILVERADDGVWSQVFVADRDSTGWTDTYPASNPSVKFKYRVRARTWGGSQGMLLSDYSNETTETAGVTTAPDAPTNLLPTGNTLINPNQVRTFTWQHNPTDQTTQTKFQVRWRVVGSPTWTENPEVNSSTSGNIFSAGTFPDNSDLEWQVRTWGANASLPSPYSASALFKTVGDPNAFREQKRVIRMNTETGRHETAPVGVLPPIGSLLIFAGPTAPAGWLLCNGAAVSRTTYADLFGVIGTAYGSGDGSTTFNLPNMADRFPMGVSGTKTRGSWGGNSTVTLGVNHLPPHTHGMNHNHGSTPQDGGHMHDFRYGSGAGTNFNQYAPGNALVGTSNQIIVTANNDPGHVHNIPNYSGDTQDGANLGLDNDWFSIQNPYQAFNYIIKV